MPTETANYGFTKDNEDEFYNVNKVNANLDKIDTEMKRIEDESKSFNEQVVDNTNAIVNANTKLDTHINDIVNHVYFGKDVGNAANSKVITIPVTVPVDYPDGLAVSFRNAVTNTGPVILQVNSRANITVVNTKGAGLVAGDMVAGLIYTVRYNATRSAFQLQGESVVTAGTQNYQAYFNPGTYNFVVPDGVTRIIASMWGAGGGGGGVSANNLYGGGGGGSGFFKEVILQVLPGEGLSVYVGSGGTGGGIGANGAPGQTTSITGAINGFFEAPGGGGGMTGQSSNAGYGGSAATAISTGFSYNISDNSMLKNGNVSNIPVSEQSKHRKFISGGAGCYGATGVGGGGGGSPSDMHFGQSGGIGNVSNPGANGGSGFGFYSTWPGGRGGSGQSTIQANGLVGGGGGGGSNSNNGSQIGGNGGNGQVVLAW